MDLAKTRANMGFNPGPREGATPDLLRQALFSA